jgi:hypothetical protein
MRPSHNQKEVSQGDGNVLLLHLEMGGLWQIYISNIDIGSFWRAVFRCSL